MDRTELANNVYKRLLKDGVRYNDKTYEFERFTKQESGPKLISDSESSGGVLGDQCTSDEQSHTALSALDKQRRSFKRQQRAKGSNVEIDGRTLILKKLLLPRKSANLHELAAIKHRYKKVGDSDSDPGSEWEHYVSNLWTSLDNNPDQWRNKLDYKAEYVDEEYISSEGHKYTYRQNLRKQERIKKRKKFRSRDPDFDNTIRNTGWKCEWPKDSADESPVSCASSPDLTPTEVEFNIGVHYRAYPPGSEIITRSTELLNRLLLYNDVYQALIIINDKVAATNIKDEEMISFLVDRVSPLALRTWKHIKDVDVTNDLVAVTIETMFYNVICAVGYGGEKNESFVLMTFQKDVHNDLMKLQHLEPGMMKPTTAKFPKIWIKGLEERPDSPPGLHLRRFREATGLKPLDETKTYRDLENVQAYIRTGEHSNSAIWREAIGPVEGQFMDKKLDVQLNTVKIARPVSRHSECLYKKDKAKDDKRKGAK